MYLDYIADHSYDELPAEVQAEISQDAYRNHRRLILAMSSNTTTALPPRLQEAFLKATQAAAPRRRLFQYWPWVAAAGWLLFLLSGLQLLRPPAEPQIVYREVVSPVPEPVIVEQTDTVYLTEEIVRYVIDTLVLAAETIAPQVVKVIDTVYLPAPTQQAELITVSRNWIGKESMLEFLVGAD